MNLYQITLSTFGTCFCSKVGLPLAFSMKDDLTCIPGVTFLFRAGLALFSCTRRILLQSTSADAILDILYHPPPNILPATPDAFIDLAFSMKLKDDDLRKQRSKLEAQVKRRTAQSRPSPISPATTQTISLPKNGI